MIILIFFYVLILLKLMFFYLFCFLKDKKSAQKVWSNDLVYEKTFRLSSRTPRRMLIEFYIS